MAIPEKQKLERVRYWQGQMLKSQDFLDIEAAEAQRRWWHNRALHNAYGVAEGLTCSLLPSNSPKIVSVSPGVAYDVFGRELILEKTLTVPLPSKVPENLTGLASLLMRYKPTSRCLRPDEISEVCWTGTGCVGTGTAEFVWKLNKNLKPSDGVSVCAVFYSGGRFKGPDPSYIVNAAQPLARPLLASGTTIPGNTPWEPWDAGFFFDDTERMLPTPIGVQTQIDTSAAGFTRVPCYFASLQGSLWNPQLQQIVSAVFPSIADESITGFTFRLWLQIPQFSVIELAFEENTGASAPAAGFAFVSDPLGFSLFAQRQELYVSWIGCQMLDTLSSCCSQQASTNAENQASASSRNF